MIRIDALHPYHAREVDSKPQGAPVQRPVIYQYSGHMGKPKSLYIQIMLGEFSKIDPNSTTECKYV